MDVSSKGFSLVERIIVFKYYSLFLTIIFAIDIFCLVAYKKNLLDQFSNLSENTFPFIHIVWFFILFGFIMTVCFPLLRVIMRYLYSLILVSNNNDENLNKDYVYIDLARKRAIKTKDSFVLGLVEKEEAMIKEDERILNILFALGALFIFEFVIDRSNNIVTYFYNLIKQETGVILYLYNAMSVIFVGTIILCFWVSLQPVSLTKMYLPEDKEDKQQS